ncbi:hypothetical protein B566_EDAN014823 [Ephemera danica]|nr:hypothetical protein B566_EDAN014823 [Ephemera danica]
MSDKLELQSRVTFLENQLIELGEKRQQERLEINDVLQSLEEEVRLLRDDDSRHELVEQRLNMSRRTIGNLVVEAVESCVNPSTQEMSPLRFLNHLHRSILEYERSSTQGLIRLALQAV